MQTAIHDQAGQHSDDNPGGNIKATSACYAHGPQESHLLSFIVALWFHVEYSPTSHLYYIIYAPAGKGQHAVWLSAVA